jgi:hypothetical protein
MSTIPFLENTAIEIDIGMSPISGQHRYELLVVHTMVAVFNSCNESAKAFAALINIHIMKRFFASPAHADPPRPR